MEKYGGKLSNPIIIFLLIAFIIRDTCPREPAHQRRHTMGDKGGKKDKDKDQKQKAVQQARDLKEKKDKQPQSASK